MTTDLDKVLYRGKDGNKGKSILSIDTPETQRTAAVSRRSSLRYHHITKKCAILCHHCSASLSLVSVMNFCTASKQESQR